ncbi:2-amino-4-hydroxy-6-hydroxymethyldihydropteridine diphosphokinase [Chitinophaga sp. SYP-B3965]|uniref:2-amino-4-hydroxy-6- hydroxymethyldihydropteridine diphosphokinase n=1 Tax=Chitinophaga sp. SYP-B3965 TaxID=2663120 RepID=UPI00129A07FD|nr:2-amino-4-hydroxy-6-hydroxymethyldihydropteridine diphosphokinase [Chitinophaga sp. SYP-B3965]MRG43699.1 2-amino-4-hydroxy-6-hydroxymethyldihydropteridine diphosphokinase [Chitinophaga sp. SYP-B3965]
MNTAILLIGGNMGDRPKFLQQAVALIAARAGHILKESTMYETAPWGDVQQPDYLNQALVLETTMEAPALLDVLLEIEKEIGRVRRQKWGSRVIDIDMIFFNQEVITLPQLKVPHPQMQNRRFVLAPLQEIIPLWVHPILQLTVNQLLEACPDPLPAFKFTTAAH